MVYGMNIMFSRFKVGCWGIEAVKNIFNYSCRHCNYAL